MGFKDFGVLFDQFRMLTLLLYVLTVCIKEKGEPVLTFFSLYLKAVF